MDFQEAVAYIKLKLYPFNPIVSSWWEPEYPILNIKIMAGGKVVNQAITQNALVDYKGRFTDLLDPMIEKLKEVLN